MNPQITETKQINLNSDDNVCRICLKMQDTLFSLFRKLHGASPYQKLSSRTNLKIELNDAGPSSICSQCLIDLDTTVSFLERCDQSNRALAAMVECNSVHRKSNSVLCSNTKDACSVIFKDEAWVEVEPLIRDDSPTEAVNAQSVPDSEDIDKAWSLLMEEQKCPECGSKRRCAHWAPPTSFSCPRCDKVFNKKYNFQIHLRRHAGARAWPCGACGAAQLSPGLAARHCRPRARLRCAAPGCGRAFTSGANLRIHMRTHTGERPFECHDCGKRFTSKKTLKGHVRIHTGEKPYICPVCGARFTTNHLSAHMRAHGAARPLACARAGCERAFAAPAALREHARTHATLRAFACALCAARYKFKQSLNRHVRARHGLSAQSDPGYQKTN